MTNQGQKVSLTSHPVSTVLLRGMRHQSGAPLNGHAMAVTLGISRVAVWKRIKKLQAGGIAIRSVTRKGYLLEEKSADLHPDMVAAAIPEELPLASVSLFTTTGSTNEDAHRLLAENKPAPLAIIAQEQTSGRGRMGKVWESPAGGNLYLSVAFRPHASPGTLEDFSLRAGLRLCQSLRSYTGIPIQLKWPNDLWVGHRKLAGLLTEARVETDQVTTLVLGFGLNVAAATLTQAAATTSLAAEGKSHLNLNSLAALLTTAILRSYEERNAPDHHHSLLALWNEFSLLQGQAIEATAPNGLRLTGLCEGIDHRGSLILRTPDQTRHVIRSGEVSVRPGPLPA